MATLTINFTPVSGISSYEICYRPVGATTPFICIEDSASPVVITSGIECGVAYDVTVRTNCPPGEYLSDQSTSAVAVATALECPPEIVCVSYTISTSSAQGQTSAYIDCMDQIQQVTVGGVSGYDATTFCAKEGSVVIAGECNLTINGPCGDPVGPITVTGAYGSMEPCIGGTIDDYMSASVSLDAPVSVDTNFNVNVLWTQLNGGSCASPNTQSFTVLVLAGQVSGQLNACNQGAYFAQGASICAAQVMGHDNTVDIINY
jgi:hypothetical protein